MWYYIKDSESIKMSFKSDFIAAHGEAAYAKRLERRRAWGANLPGGEAQRSQERRDADPEMTWQSDRKGGKYYERKLKYDRNGLRGERMRIRHRHGKKWAKYKRIIAPNSVIHHSWIPNTAEYTGVGLVEKTAHEYGIIKVIEILDGNIRIFTEREIREQEIKK